MTTHLTKIWWDLNKHKLVEQVIPEAEIYKQEPATVEVVYETIIQWDEGGGKRSRRELARRIVALYTAPQPNTIANSEAIPEQISEQGQEPVAWLYRDSWGTMKLSQVMPPPVGAFPVYTTPPQPDIKVNFEAIPKQISEQEPVAHLWQHSETGRTRIVMPDQIITADATWHVVGPLYLGAPPRREWQGLTEEEVKAVHRNAGITYFVPADYDRHLFTHMTDVQLMRVARAIEAKLREKNQ